MTQSLLIVETLPASSLEASAAFIKKHLKSVSEGLADDEVSDFVIVLPGASPDQDDWRKAIALDLAREFAPKRINIVSTNDTDAVGKTLAYLRDAKGVTGQYLQTHE